MSEIKFPRMHVSLYVSDLTATVNFYTTFFGVPASKIKKGYAKYELENPGLIISFVENPERVSDDFGHLGFQVGSREEMEAKLEVAKAQGIVSLEEMGTACCYAVQDKFWVTDPDGVRWEVYYFHEDSEWNDPKYAMEDASACCAPTAEYANEGVKVEKGSVEKPRVRLSDIGKENSCTPGSGCC